MSAARAWRGWPSVYAGSMADMRSWSWPRGAYQSSRPGSAPRCRGHAHAATGPREGEVHRALGVRDDSITPRHAPRVVPAPAR